MPGDIYATYNPFCIFWFDTVDNEQGFILVLEYSDYEKVYDRFIFRTDADVTTLILPEDYAPRLQESWEQCIERKSSTIKLYAAPHLKISSVPMDGCNFLSPLT